MSSVFSYIAPPADAPPPIAPQALPSYPSKEPVVELNLMYPAAGEPSRCAVVPLGNKPAPVLEVLVTVVASGEASSALVPCAAVA